MENTIGNLFSLESTNISCQNLHCLNINSTNETISNIETTITQNNIISNINYAYITEGSCAIATIGSLFLGNSINYINHFTTNFSIANNTQSPITKTINILNNLPLNGNYKFFGNISNNSPDALFVNSYSQSNTEFLINIAVINHTTKFSSNTQYTMSSLLIS
jgi:hypothetical protein